jgi:uroporphyrinogen-III decarboxylase
MPEYVDFDCDSIEKVRSFTFDDPWDERRYFKEHDDHLSGIGDDIVLRNTSSYKQRVYDLAKEFAVFGGVIEAAEFMVRCIGQANLLLWIGMYPEEIGRFAERINEFALEIVRAQIEAADGLLDGIHIAGDVAYTRAMFFSPEYWRRYFKPGVKAIIDWVHSHGLPVTYHSCGNVASILDDFADIHLDGLHPLEAKAGLDVVDLRRKMGHRLAFIGNNDVRVWAEGERQHLKAYTLRKLNAGKGGGYIFSSDHSVPADVSGETYDYLMGLLKKYGTYPLELGEYDIEMPR